MTIVFIVDHCKQNTEEAKGLALCFSRFIEKIQNMPRRSGNESCETAVRCAAGVNELELLQGLFPLVMEGLMGWIMMFADDTEI